MKQLILMLTLLSISLVGFAQHKIEGKVKDVANEPVIGASVYPKGSTSIGTITDLDGRFSLEMPDGSDIVLGLKPKKLIPRASQKCL